ncbi:MAG TPA: HEAT repeat domain-containing protein [Terriglobales bacterium]
MEFIFRSLEMGLPGLVLRAILLLLLSISLLIAFIVARRWYRGRYFRRLNQRMLFFRSAWDNLVSGQIPPKTWRLNHFDSKIVETILLDNMEVAIPEELPGLLRCLRESGLLDMRIYQARHLRGWKRRDVLIVLGRTRAPEVIPALSEALDDPALQTRIAAVRGLGRIGLADAAVPLLERFLSGELEVPEHTLKNALVHCCRDSPGLLIQYLHHAGGHKRELLARVLGEVANSGLAEELLTLATDPLAEVRASAARALGNVQDPLALWALAKLLEDQEWFVRLRAVVALTSLKQSGRTRLLLRGLCDSNRSVRQRAAWALARIEPDLGALLEQVVATQDRYALQAFISELERSGAMQDVIHSLEVESAHGVAQSILMQALVAGREGVESARTTKAATAAAGAGR